MTDGVARLHLPNNLKERLGTRSEAFAQHMVERLTALSRVDGTAPSATVINAALAFIDGLDPQNEMEAMAALMLFVTQDAALSLLARTRNATDVVNCELSGNLAAKLMRAGTAQMEALARLRRGGEQSVKVEHVHVYEGGQAIVGNVEQRGGGQRNIAGQCHAPCSTAMGVTPLLGVDEAGHVVPVAGNGKREVSDARRHKSRRPQGQS